MLAAPILHQLSPCFDTCSFELDLRRTPSAAGRGTNKAAVERAKSFGFPVIVWVGGHSGAGGRPRIKVGAISSAREDVVPEEEDKSKFPQ